MIQENDIKDILKTAGAKHKGTSLKDVAFVILCDTINDKNTAFEVIYGTKTNLGEKFYGSEEIVALREVMQPFGIGISDEDLITRAENKAELMKLLPELRRLKDNGEIEAKDAVKMEIDIRSKLNDKFDMEEAEGEKRIIVVPQKHDYICPHTNRECTKMPSKKACIDYYGLKE